MPRGLSNASLRKQAGKNSGRAMTNNKYLNSDTHIRGQRPFIGRFFIPLIIRSSIHSILHLHRPYKNMSRTRYMYQVNEFHLRINKL
ncbi:hypothetical protein ALC62_01313 [Cyphomyrmex costatus]|uniref:Uncharacterized protein n=1 Tax=Cyphomyrmex costatus TaxID=456900 RepID=A0A195D4J6_9HYME|nr:hypothetical protein ALC62_01313 [Cyphomyrmex costatus]